MHETWEQIGQSHTFNQTQVCLLAPSNTTLSSTLVWCGWTITCCMLFMPHWCFWKITSYWAKTHIIRNQSYLIWQKNTWFDKTLDSRSIWKFKFKNSLSLVFLLKILKRESEITLKLKVLTGLKRIKYLKVLPYNFFQNSRKNI